MQSRVAILFSLAIVVVASAPLLAGTIPCESSVIDECTAAPTCQEDGSCRGEPARQGLPCTQDTSGGCMTNPVCQQGACIGTVPAASGTECHFPGLEKCFEAGQCASAGGFSFCLPGRQKTCPPASDPCKQSFCNPQNGNCEVGDKCFTFSGCEVCDAGTCRPVNIGAACKNPEGDFNPCTTDDRCVVEELPGPFPELNAASHSRLPLGLAAAMYNAPQVTQMRGFCIGVPGVGPPPTATPTPTPTIGPASCVGDCNGDGEVTVDELLTMVNVALGNAQVSACLRGDGNGDGEITIDEILTAVNGALSGCVR